MNAPQIVTNAPPDRADAPDLALIHGWGIGRAAWDEVLPRLAERFSVHRASLPGYDGSVDTTDAAPGLGEDDTARAFDACAAALTHALPAGCTLCGWSLGALLALRAAQLAPQRFSRLILCGATPCFTQRDDWPHAQAPAILDGFAAALAQDSAATRQRFAALFNQGDGRARQITRGFTRALAEETAAAAPAPAGLARGLAWLRWIDLRAAIRANLPQLPVLLVHGARDPLMPLPAARWLVETLPDARLEVFPDAAHAPFASDAPRFAQLLIDFCHA
jgi:pimeloyl-[acyl-carrier protein] methyl ester esterase